MKKNEFMKHLVLGTLFLILVVPVFNTASLYGNTSTLTGWEKDVARYFLSIAFEIAIFVCVKAGYRPAGIFFAIVSLIIGLLYHVPFTDIREFDQYYTHKFLSSVVIQIGISTMVYFLSELYVLLLKREYAEHHITDVLNNLNIAQSQLALIEHKKEMMVSDLSEIEQKVINYQREEKILIEAIASLKKQKAGLSRGLTENNN